MFLVYSILPYNCLQQSNMFRYKYSSFLITCNSFSLIDSTNSYFELLPGLGLMRYK